MRSVTTRQHKCRIQLHLEAGTQNLVIFSSCLRLNAVMFWNFDCGLCLHRQMEPLESDVFVDGVGSDIEGEEFNSEGCQWEEEEVVVEDDEEKQVMTAKPPSAAAAIPEKVFCLESL